REEERNPGQRHQEEANHHGPVTGALKPLAAAGFIATFAGLIFHYIGIGPNKEVDDDEEDHHE
ncbi:formate dehydrogenase N subunit beta transmembrane domain-containing protein, partial [Escherichia coli]